MEEGSVLVRTPEGLCAAVVSSLVLESVSISSALLFVAKASGNQERQKGYYIFSPQELRVLGFP